MPCVKSAVCIVCGVCSVCSVCVCSVCSVCSVCVCSVCIVCGIGFIHGTCLNSLYTSNASFPLPPPPSPTSVLRALHVVSSPLVFWLCTAE